MLPTLDLMHEVDRCPFSGVAMNENKTNNYLLRAGITVTALLVILVHLIWPGLYIDAITVTLLFVGLAPWLSSVFKSLEFPGGWKIEFQEIKEQLNSIIASDTEPIKRAAGPRMGIEAYSADDQATRLVIRALGNPKYTWRYLGGLIAETQLSEKEVLASVNWLQKNRLITESLARDEKLWALSQDGRDLLTSLN
jgi:hypothetical protein